MTVQHSPPGRLGRIFDACHAEGRAALIGYLPTGYPDVATSIGAMVAMSADCDIIEVGVPYSDPGMDGPVIATATEAALQAGVRVADTIPDEADAWLAAAEQHDLDRIFLVAPSSTPERLARTVAASRGFVYAASTMGVTGARDAVSSAAPELVRRVKEISDIPVGVGLGVRSREQAAEIAHYADGVIVGSALVSALTDGVPAVQTLAGELAGGVRDKVSAS